MHQTKPRKHCGRSTRRTSNPRSSRPGDSYARARKSRRTRADNENVPTAVYRLYDTDGALLYVGVSNSPGGRQRSHEKKYRWFKRVTTTTYTWFDTRSEAEAEERRLIDELVPHYNVHRGIRTRHYVGRHSPRRAPDSPVCDRPRHLPPRERILATLTEASEPLSFEEIKRRTSGKTQSLRGAIDEVLARGEAVSVKGTNGNRVVLVGREHLLEQTITKQATGTVRERILSLLRDLDTPIALSGVVKRTRGKTSDIMLETQKLITEGVLTETAGPRRARLVAISR